jgi:hypothetical protein
MKFTTMAIKKQVMGGSDLFQKSYFQNFITAAKEN